MELLRPSSPEEAAAALRDGRIALAGGTDLVPLLREGLVEADTLVHLSHVVPRGVKSWGQSPAGTVPSGSAGASIGAGTTLAELEADPQIPAVLREACAAAASPQLRNAGTIGGNLLQATRCWYWRLDFPCWLRGGDRCHAREGQHREHAIFANDRCASAHPSDPAAALLALGATLRTTERELPVAELYRLPDDRDRATTTLRRGELILELDVPRPDASVYLKAMDRAKWSFPLVGVAAARFGEEVRLGLAGVAPVPWTLESIEELDGATPLRGTAYKVEIARALVRRALAHVGAAAD